MPKSTCYILLVLVLISCKKEQKDPPQTPTDQGKGNIQGKVDHYDYEGVGDTLTLHMTTVVIEPAKQQTVTDSLGAFSFKDLPAGVYELSFLRKETGLSKKSDVVVNSGATTQLDAAVYDTASWYITSLSFKDSLLDSGKALVLSVSVPLIDKQLYLQACFGKKPNIDARASLTFDLVKTFIHPRNKSNCTYFFPYKLLYERNYSAGDSLYIKLFPTNPNAGYTEKPSGNWLCTGTGKAYQTVGLIIP